MKYYILAGEASGDLHASNLIKALRQEDTQAEFVGMGGDKMRAEGCRLIQDYRQMAFMGIIAVLANLGKIKANFQLAKRSLMEEQPDVLILIDYPSFNLKIAGYCKQYLPHTKVIYYIPPKIWAWKTFRVHEIARVSDQILGIFPFEPDFYQKYGYQCTYVGNPTVESVQLNSKKLQKSRGVHNICTKDEALIALLPGSRKGEIRNCLPKMLEAARRVNRQLNNSCRIVVTAAPGIEDSYYSRWLHGEELTRDTYELLSQSAAAVVNSGTATLETALIGCPQTAVYRIVCSRWLGWLKPFIFKIPYFTLVNIIPQREVIKELIAFNFTTNKIQKELMRLLTDEAYKKDMLAGYEHIQSVLGTQSAAQTAAELIVHA